MSANVWKARERIQFALLLTLSLSLTHSFTLFLHTLWHNQTLSHSVFRGCVRERVGERMNKVEFARAGERLMERERKRESLFYAAEKDFGAGRSRSP